MTSAESTAINGHDRGEDPFDHPQAGERNADHPIVIAEAKDASKRRRTRWGKRQYAVAALTAVTDPWARSLAAEIGRRNAKRDPTAVPVLVFNGGEAVDQGATDAQLAALPELSPADIEGLWLDAAATKRAMWLRADALARKQIADTTSGVELPPVVSLGDLLAQPDDPVRMRIEGVWPSGGAKVLCAAPAGGGKTTLSGNLVRSMADGVPFLGRFDVNQTAERIVIIDNEMTQGMLRRWLRRQGLRNTAAVVDVVNVRGKAGVFDMGNDRLRGEWSRRLRDLGCDFLVFDCLKPVLEAMGLDENRETGKFLYPFATMLAEAGVDDALVHHHMGHSSERARGDSTMLGWSDANWKIIRKDDLPAQPRFFATDKVRDADPPVGEGLLSFDPETGHLTYVGGNRVETQESEDIDKRMRAVLELLADRRAEVGDGGDHRLTTTALRREVKGRATAIDNAIRQATKRELVDAVRRGAGTLYGITAKGLDPVNW